MRCLSPLRKDSSAKPTWYDSHPGPGHQPLAHSPPLSQSAAPKRSRTAATNANLWAEWRGPGLGGAQEVRGAGTRGPQAASRESAQAGKPAEVHRQPVNPTSRLTAPPRFWRACLSGFPQIIFGIFYFPLKHFRLASDGHNITPKYFVIPVLNDVVVPSLNSHTLEGK